MNTRIKVRIERSKKAANGSQQSVSQQAISVPPTSVRRDSLSRAIPTKKDVDRFMVELNDAFRRGREQRQQ